MHKRLLLRCWKDDTAQDVIEYGLIAVLVSVIAVSAVQNVGAAVSRFWDRISTALSH